MAEKLYVVVREDLAPGPQAVQAMHAFRQFQELHGDLERSWFRRSNHIAFLSVRDEAALRGLVDKALTDGFRHAGFNEPDLGGALTAVAFEPGAKRILRRLPPALSGRDVR